MKWIQVRAVKNIISRTVSGTFQEVTFFLRSAGAGFGKRVEVHWCGPGGAWQVEPARFSHAEGDGLECWMARLRFPLTRHSGLPGDIRFAARMEGPGWTVWDSRFGENHLSEADSGWTVFGDENVAVPGWTPELAAGRLALPVEVAVRQGLDPESVVIHWSVDGWVTRRETRAVFRLHHWASAEGSRAPNPNGRGWGIWAARLPVGAAYRVEYAVECRTRGGTVWASRGGRNYAASRGTLRMMTLNLHTYQEEDQLRKFEVIARAIREQKIDVACLQEVGEHWNNGAGDWASNAARIINSHLPEPFYLHTDWSHLGFDQFREGVAVLSRFPFVYTDSGYVSDSQDPYDIHSRKVVMVQIQVPYFGLLNVFSTHLSWPSDGFYPQFDRLREWAAQRHGAAVTGTLLCGDFNITAGTEPYRHIVETGEYEDQFLKIDRPPVFQRIFRRRSGDLGELLNRDGRIDYLWLRNDSRLRAVAAGELFTPDRYGRVSDHTGYWVEFELR